MDSQVINRKINNYNLAIKNIDLAITKYKESLVCLEKIKGIKDCNVLISNIENKIVELNKFKNQIINNINKMKNELKTIEENNR